MKILHVADLHDHSASLTWVAAQASHHDVTVIAGDLLNQFTPDRSAQIPRARAWLRSLPGPVVMCSGNHDYFPSGPTTRAWGAGRWLRTLMGKTPTGAPEQSITETVVRTGLMADGTRFNLGGFRWKVSGWSAARADTTGAGVDVLVVHAPPAGTPVGMEGLRDLGDGEVRRAVLHPRCLRSHPSRCALDHHHPRRAVTDRDHH